ncbi:unnamed protein product [Spirodela intermedia]|uniref:Clp R domain-containing protein n=1 Tax=Spirodela intermedia TaxID=51605 RepID=A0A7I8LDR7_SPIIN|nr:unnamed protein product [Spirodela intermedia]
MRAGLSTIQQTLTPEASSVINQSISEAARRRHSQTTPLHVAAALLASPAGVFRQACVSSHPNSCHPLQCRALELCFSVSLDRLPAASASSGGAAVEQPPISNALVAALKRAQAHQRRGCPEQQQQPLLAVKVELEQLIVSILDDPSVSRVMREASFSSPAVKTMIQQSLVLSAHFPVAAASTSFQPAGDAIAGGLLFSLSPSTANTGSLLLPPASQNPYLNPRLPQKQGSNGNVVERILQVLRKRKKRNPILVGDRHPAELLDEILQRIEMRETGDVAVITLENYLASDGSQTPLKLDELGNSIVAILRDRSGGVAGDGVVLNLGDLRWLVESPGCGIGDSTGSSLVPHRQKIVLQSGREVVAEMAKLLRHFAEDSGGKVWLIGTASCATYLRCQVYHPSMEKDWDLQALPIAAGETGEFYAESKPEPRDHLPPWLRVASLSHGSPQTKEKENTEEVLKRWTETCRHLHPSLHEVDDDLDKQATPPHYSSGLPFRQVPPTKLPPVRSPVRTDLVLGLPPAGSRRELDMFSGHQGYQVLGSLGPDSLKRIFKGLSVKVTWQREAASLVAAAVVQCKSDGGKRRRDVWLLFLGHDRMGKKKMAEALAELVTGAAPIFVPLGGHSPEERGGVDLRGKTALDGVAQAVRRNPSSVIVLEDIDRADLLIQKYLKQAMERGRLLDSHGREVPLGDAIFILISHSSPEHLKSSEDEEKLRAAASSGWQLEIIVGEDAAAKRRAEWPCDEGKLPVKARKQSLDLNLVADADEDASPEGSPRSSDLTDDQTDYGRLAMNDDGFPRSTISAMNDYGSHLVNAVDGAVVFKPVDFGDLRRKVSEAIAGEFSAVFRGGRAALWIDEEALDRVVAGVWFGTAEFEEWVLKILAPAFRELRACSALGGAAVVRLLPVKDRCRRGARECLPSLVRVSMA